jgi:hypothetical protein
MIGLPGVVDLPEFYELLGRDAEFVYGATPWVPQLVELRAGGLIPIARQHPGAREFVESYKKEFPGAEISFPSAAGYGGCPILIEAIRRAGSLDSGNPRDAILKMNHNTVVGPAALPHAAVESAPVSRVAVADHDRIAHACRGRRPDHTSQKCPGGRRSIRLMVGLIV